MINAIKDAMKMSMLVTSVWGSMTDGFPTTDRSFGMESTRSLLDILQGWQDGRY